MSEGRQKIDAVSGDIEGDDGRSPLIAQMMAALNASRIDAADKLSALVIVTAMALKAYVPEDRVHVGADVFAEDLREAIDKVWVTTENRQ